MNYDVLVTKHPQNGYTARPLLLPDLVITGIDESEVLERMRKAIADVQSQSHIVQLDVPTNGRSTDDPWMKFAGMWEDDPEWEQFQSDIEDFRREIDEQNSDSIEH